ncbi:LacI family DNA-binding transcriptional regulator [Tateyamaria pelophila]|uniref:LacI family DNA-binding transcriptional regulator n=1 Tax=Tateyamaria pelophila TaxID=328415 RepID=UPI001CC0399E|nr:LacI family DNA-binding transcriptional regulator [Tateyamaria pelophila]
MVSIKDIASDLGITAATVSNALSGKGRVSQDMVQRIRARADELGYRPNLAGRALRSGRTGILGLVMPDLTNPLFPRIAQTISNEADARQLGILIADSRGSAAEQSAALRRLLNLGVDGLLVVPQKGTSPDPMPVPVAVINTQSDPQNAVSADHVGGGALIARHIAEIGHRHLLLLGGDPVSEVQSDRIKGMTSALPADIQVDVLWGADGLAAVPERISQGVTAILTTSDLIALQVHSSLLRAQIPVPDRVSLTGFDNMSISSIMHPRLTTVAQNVEDIAARAIAIITAMIAGTPPPHLGEVVPMRLVIRQSTAIPN